MVKLTRAQREALYRVYKRTPLNANAVSCSAVWQKPITYRQFRRLVRPYIGGKCIIVPWCGMYLGIEKDGYTHS